MNAVEAVERLAEIGRRMQARELGLQQPLAALHLAGEWEKVLVDPVTALSVLLGNAGDGQGRAEVVGSETAARPPAPFQWEKEHTPGVDESPARRGEADGVRGNEMSPAAGVRLARQHASLLGILNANLENRAEGREHGHVDVPTEPARGVAGGPHKSVRATREGSPVEERESVGWSDVPRGQDRGVRRATFVNAESVEHPHVRSGLASSGFRQGAREPHVDVLTAQDGMQDRQGPAWRMERAALDDGEADAATGAQSDAWVDDSGLSIGPVMQYGHEGVLADPQVGVVRRQGRLATQGGLRVEGRDGSGEDRVHRDWGAASPLEGEVWTKTDDVKEEQPLSMAQIEQVLAALDERLELMLLRMYGAAGGLP
jgi:hypothetical protein